MLSFCEVPLLGRWMPGPLRDWEQEPSRLLLYWWSVYQHWLYYTRTTRYINIKYCFSHVLHYSFPTLTAFRHLHLLCLCRTAFLSVSLSHQPRAVPYTLSRCPLPPPRECLSQWVQGCFPSPTLMSGPQKMSGCNVTVIPICLSLYNLMWVPWPFYK